MLSVEVGMLLTSSVWFTSDLKVALQVFIAACLVEGVSLSNVLAASSNSSCLNMNIENKCNFFFGL